MCDESPNGALVICLSNKGYTGSCIAEHRTFGLSIEGKDLKDATLKAGICTDRDHDNAAELDTPLMDALYTFQGYGQLDTIWLEPGIKAKTC